jgi:hypothetical protein
MFTVSNSGDVTIVGGLTVSAGGIDINNGLVITGGLRVDGGGLKTTNGLTISNSKLTVSGGLEITGGLTTSATNAFSVAGGLSSQNSVVQLSTITVGSGGLSFNGFEFSVSPSNCNSNDFGCFITPPSDRRFKRDITGMPIHEALRQIMATRPVSYMWRDDAPFGLSEDRRSQVGFIAQELEEALDHEGASVVHRTASPSGGEILTVDYGRLTALLAGAVQAQEEEINKIASHFGIDLA